MASSAVARPLYRSLRRSAGHFVKEVQKLPLSARRFEMQMLFQACADASIPEHPLDASLAMANNPAVEACAMTVSTLPAHLRSSYRDLSKCPKGLDGAFAVHRLLSERTGVLKRLVMEESSTAATDKVEITMTTHCKSPWDPTEFQGKPIEFRLFYTLSIKNQETATEGVVLSTRDWNIFDLMGNTHDIRGDIPGDAPRMLAPGESFTYSAFIPLEYPLATLSGTVTCFSESGQAIAAKVAPVCLSALADHATSDGTVLPHRTEEVQVRQARQMGAEA